MSEDTILVVGGTGLLGRAVAWRLRQDGFAVRLFARDPAQARAALGPDFEYRAGDVDDPAAVERALDDCAGVHVSLSGGADPAAVERIEHRGTARVAAAAARRGVPRLTYLSQMLVAEDAAIPEHRAKFRAERAIRRSGVPYTIFKPTYFMETLPRHVRGRLAVVMGRQPHPLHLVAADDFARMVAHSFRTPEAANRSFFVHGPEAVTIPAALRLYCAALAPGTRVVSLPLWSVALLDVLVMRRQLRGTIQLMRLIQRVGERGDPAEANRLLGAPTTTLRRWCEQRRAGRHKRSRTASEQSA